MRIHLVSLLLVCLAASFLAQTAHAFTPQPTKDVYHLANEKVFLQDEVTRVDITMP